MTKDYFYDNIFAEYFLGVINMARRRDPLELNKREKAILRFIERELNENGYPPSVREIGKAVGLKSTATVHSYLGRLEEAGYISRKDKKGRTLQLIKGGKPYKPHPVEHKNVYAGKEMVEVPVDNGGSQWLEMFDVGLPSVGIQSVLSGCQHHVAGVAAVTGYATIGSQLLQRQPFAVIGK